MVALKSNAIISFNECDINVVNHALGTCATPFVGNVFLLKNTPSRDEDVTKVLTCSRFQIGMMWIKNQDFLKMVCVTGCVTCVAGLHYVRDRAA